jgi:hypothetical protein
MYLVNYADVKARCSSSRRLDESYIHPKAHASVPNTCIPARWPARIIYISEYPRLHLVSKSSTTAIRYVRIVFPLDFGFACRLVGSVSSTLMPAPGGTGRDPEGTAPGGDGAPAVARSQTMHQMMAARASRGGRDAGHGGGLPTATASMQAPEESPAD